MPAPPEKPRVRRFLDLARRAGAGWRTLTWREKLETVYLVVLAAAAEIAVRLLPLPRLTRRLGINLQAEEPGGTAPVRGKRRAVSFSVSQRAAAVDRLYRVWPRRGSCLRRALVLGWRVRAANPTLRLGVADEHGSVHAHAWIEIDGKPLGDGSHGYTPLRGASGEAVDGAL